MDWGASGSSAAGGGRFDYLVAVSERDYPPHLGVVACFLAIFFGFRLIVLL